VMNHFKSKAKDKTIYLFGGSESEGAVVHGVYVGTVSSVYPLIPFPILTGTRSTPPRASQPSTGPLQSQKSWGADREARNPREQVKELTPRRSRRPSRLQRNGLLRSLSCEARPSKGYPGHECLPSYARSGFFEVGR